MTTLLNLFSRLYLPEVLRSRWIHYQLTGKLDLQRRHLEFGRFRFAAVLFAHMYIFVVWLGVCWVIC